MVIELYFIRALKCVERKHPGGTEGVSYLLEIGHILELCKGKLRYRTYISL